MKTLTITDAKKNLSKWLQAAAQGEEIAIVSGADLIALRKVEVEASDYAWREYGLTQDEVAAYEQRVDSRYLRLKQAGDLNVFTVDDVEDRMAKAKVRVKSDAALRVVTHERAKRAAKGIRERRSIEKAPHN